MRLSWCGDSLDGVAASVGCQSQWGDSLSGVTATLPMASTSISNESTLPLHQQNSSREI